MGEALLHTGVHQIFTDAVRGAGLGRGRAVVPAAD